MITPKPFQQTYIGNVLTLFRGAKSHLDEVVPDFERRRVFAYNGSCLLKAPTGAGKTLIAGTVAEQFSREETVEFFKDALKPDYCLMVTATPDDADAEHFTKAAAIKDLHRVTVSREEAVEAGCRRIGR